MDWLFSVSGKAIDVDCAVRPNTPVLVDDSIGRVVADAPRRRRGYGSMPMRLFTAPALPRGFIARQLKLQARQSSVSRKPGRLGYIRDSVPKGPCVSRVRSRRVLPAAMFVPYVRSPLGGWWCRDRPQ